MVVVDSECEAIMLVVLRQDTIGGGTYVEGLAAEVILVKLHGFEISFEEDSLVGWPPINTILSIACSNIM